MTELTDWFSALEAGDRDAFNRIFATLYPDLRHLARARLSQGARLTLLDTSALVHECYLRFLKCEIVGLANRRHFFAYCSRVMRSIIVDAARARRALQRGGDLTKVTLDTAHRDEIPEAEDQVIELAEAIDGLAKIDDRLAQTMELRLFGGFNEAEIAETLGVSDRTVRRDIEKARLLMAASIR